jgi:hypothetical protein
MNLYLQGIIIEKKTLIMHIIRFQDSLFTKLRQQVLLMGGNKTVQNDKMCNKSKDGIQETNCIKATNYC